MKKINSLSRTWLGDIFKGKSKVASTIIASFKKLLTTGVKLSIDLLKTSSNSLLSYGYTYITVFFSLIHDVFFKLFILSLNFIVIYPSLFIDVIFPLQSLLIVILAGFT